jgi:hypothetical protein
MTIGQRDGLIGGVQARVRDRPPGRDAQPSATLAASTGLAGAAGAPLVTSSLHVPGSAWILSQQWFTKGGRP